MQLIDLLAQELMCVLSLPPFDAIRFQPIRILRILNRRHPDTQVILLVNKHIPVLAHLAAKHLGVMGYILMQDPRITHLVDVIRHVLVPGACWQLCWRCQIACQLYIVHSSRSPTKSPLLAISLAVHLLVSISVERVVVVAIAGATMPRIDLFC